MKQHPVHHRHVQQRWAPQPQQLPEPWIAVVRFVRWTQEQVVTQATIYHGQSRRRKQYVQHRLGSAVDRSAHLLIKLTAVAVLRTRLHVRPSWSGDIRETMLKAWTTTSVAALAE